jgi:hypothetical protein
MLHSPKHFTQGLILLATFTVVLILMFLPFSFLGQKDDGTAMNGLEYADDFFNRLSKGSSDFSEEVNAGVAKIAGKDVEVSFKLKKAEGNPAALALAAKAGLAGEVQDGAVALKGDLAKLLALAVADSKAMYANNGKAVTRLDGLDERGVMKLWWEMLDSMIKPLQKKKLIAEANVVNLVNKKAVEPGYNFYGVQGEKVIERIPMLTFLLVFYVAYTMWYGFAIFDLFDGVGLSMKKPKVKAEV